MIRETEQERSRRMRRMIIRKVVLLGLVVVVMGGISAYQAGYAVLVGGFMSAETTSNGIASLTCTYFNGSEKVISHVMRPVSNAQRSTHCPWAMKLPRLGPSSDMGIPLPRQPLPAPDAAESTVPSVPAPAPEATPAPDATPAPAANPSPN
jgi:hypothetical protein